MKSFTYLYVIGCLSVDNHPGMTVKKFETLKKRWMCRSSESQFGPYPSGWMGKNDLRFELVYCKSQEPNLTCLQKKTLAESDMSAKDDLARSSKNNQKLHLAMWALATNTNNLGSLNLGFDWPLLIIIIIINN